MGIFDRLPRLLRAPATNRLERIDAAWSGGFSASSLVNSGWVNPITGLGQSGVDPTAAIRYHRGHMPTPGMIDSLYTHDWLAERIIEKMPNTAMIRGFLVDGKDSAESDLHRDFEQLNVTERFPRGAFERAVNDGRAYGGSVLMIGYKQGDPVTPLAPGQADGGVAFFDVFAQHELVVLERYADPASPDFGMPSVYQVIAGNSSGVVHPRVGQVFHASRALRFSGKPLRVPGAGMGVTMDGPEIGVSVLVSVLQDIGRFGLAWAAVSNMLQDASIGVFKISGLVEALAEKDQDVIEDRLRVLQRTKSVHRAVFLDTDNGEDYQRVDVSLADVPGVLAQVILACSGAADVPAKILFGTSPMGLNANSAGEADFTQFYNTCADYQRRYLGPKLETLLAAVAGRGGPATAAPSGARADSDGPRVTWPSLWESSDNEMAQTRLTNANATKVYWDMGVIEASDIVRAAQENTEPVLLGTPDDNRVVLSNGEGGGDPTAAPQGGPDAKGAAKVASAERKAQTTEKQAKP